MKRMVYIFIFSLLLAGCHTSKNINLELKDNVTIELGKQVQLQIEDFLILDQYTEEQISEIKSNCEIELCGETSDGNKYLPVGSYGINILYLDKTYETRLTVEDTVAPVFKDIEKLVLKNGDKDYDFSLKVKADDFSKVVYEFDKGEIDFDKKGEYKLKVTATDEYGNSSIKEFDVQIKEKPKTNNEQKSDKSENNNTGTQQNENKPSSNTGTQPNTNKPAGNTGTQPNTNKPAGNTGTQQNENNSKTELEILCDNVLNKIVDDSMSDREKAYAIYQWVESNIRYSGTSKVENWKTGALKALKYKKGNCLAFLYASEALLNRVGIESIEVHDDEYTHYWNMVKINGAWYHFDTTTGWGKQRFLWTNKQLKEYSFYNSILDINITYEWDETAYPATPE